MSGSIYGKGPYGKGKYSRGPGINDAGVVVIAPSRVALSGDLLPIAPNRLAIVNYTQIRVAGTIIRVSMHVIEQAALVQISGETLWEKLAVPACMPWWFVGQPASWSARPNNAGAMFP
jgi:hypothetical protein